MSPSWFHLFASISHTGALQVIILSRTSASLLSCAQNDKKNKKKTCACSNHYKSKSSWEDKKQETSATSDITDCDCKPPPRGRTLWCRREVTITSPRDGGSSSYELNLTFLQKISSRSQQHQLWWSWSCPLGSVPQGRWLWFQPACGWRSVRAWSGSVCREKKRKSALAYFCPDCKQILISNQ